MKSLAKELFIIALLVMIVVFTIGIIFYQYMPNNKTVPEPITYTADSSTTAVLQEIKAATDDATGDSESESIIKSYSIGSKDLSAAALRQSYTSGKTDPFAEVPKDNSNTTTGNTVASTNTTNTNSTTTNNTTTSTPAQNTGATGTFFEKPNSK